MKEQEWVGGLLGIPLGGAAAVGMFLARNWLCHHAAVPLAVLGWLLAAVIVYYVIAIYRTPESTIESPNVAHMGAVMVGGLMALLSLLAMYQWWRGVGGSHRFAYLVVEGVVAVGVGYGFNRGSEWLADVLCGDDDEILDAYNGARAVSVGFGMALGFGLIALEFIRPFMVASLRG